MAFSSIVFAFEKTTETQMNSSVVQMMETYPEDDGRDYPLSAMTALADSEYPGYANEGPAYYVLDDDKNK